LKVSKSEILKKESESQEKIDPWSSRQKLRNVYGSDFVRTSKSRKIRKF
jgi:hypothetical protein